VALRICVTHTPALPMGLCTRCCLCLEQSPSWCHRLHGVSFLTFHLHQSVPLGDRNWSLMFIRQAGCFVEGSKAGRPRGLLCLSQARRVAVRGAFVSLWFAAGAGDWERNKGDKGVQTGAGLSQEAEDTDVSRARRVTDAPPGTLCGTGNRNSGSQSARAMGIAHLGEAFRVGVEQAISSCPEEVHGRHGLSTEITWVRMDVALCSPGGFLAGARALCMTLAELSCPDCERGRRACLTPHRHPTPHCSTWGLPLGVAGSWLTVATVEALGGWGMGVRRTGQVGPTMHPPPVSGASTLLLHLLLLLLIIIILTC
uniref:Myeloma overexpressed n=1 Tax=Pongo abelii TaxID=9601 RepID=A0A8I5U575_PONAB